MAQEVSRNQLSIKLLFVEQIMTQYFVSGLLLNCTLHLYFY